MLCGVGVELVNGEQFSALSNVDAVRIRGHRNRPAHATVRTRTTPRRTEPIGQSCCEPLPTAMAGAVDRIHLRTECERPLCSPPMTASAKRECRRWVNKRPFADRTRLPRSLPQRRHIWNRSVTRRCTMSSGTRANLWARKRRSSNARSGQFERPRTRSLQSRDRQQAPFMRPRTAASPRHLPRRARCLARNRHAAKDTEACPVRDH
jgi:hypothetical protein